MSIKLVKNLFRNPPDEGGIIQLRLQFNACINNFTTLSRFYSLSVRSFMSFMSTKEHIQKQDGMFNGEMNTQSRMWVILFLTSLIQLNILLMMLLITIIGIVKINPCFFSQDKLDGQRYSPVILKLQV